MKKHGKGKGLMTVRSNTEKKYGMGKGLMTVWRAMHPNSGPFPTGLSVISKEATVKRPKKSVSLVCHIHCRYLLHNKIFLANMTS